MTDDQWRQALDLVHSSRRLLQCKILQGPVGYTNAKLARSYPDRSVAVTDVNNWEQTTCTCLKLTTFRSITLGIGLRLGLSECPVGCVSVAGSVVILVLCVVVQKSLLFRKSIPKPKPNPNLNRKQGSSATSEQRTLRVGRVLCLDLLPRHGEGLIKVVVI